MTFITRPIASAPPRGPVTPAVERPTTGPEPMSVMNLSARQRMLSQRLALQIVLGVRGDVAQLTAARQTLTLFEQSQTTLVQTAQNLRNGDGETLRSVYFGPLNVARRVAHFIQYARTALEYAQSHAAAAESAVAQLVACTDDVLQALNAATTAYDQITTAKEVAIMRELKGIVGDIQIVAREAKLVSFNAQVFAARAGAAGREFAVVAGTLSSISTEVDNLAKKGMALASR